MHDPKSQKTAFHFRVFADHQLQYKSDALTFHDPQEAWHDGAMSACETIRGMHGRIEGDGLADRGVRRDRESYRFTFKGERP